MPSLESIFAQLEDGKAVRIALPMKTGSEKFRASCVYKRVAPPRFSLLFAEGDLPKDLDPHRKCAVLLDLAGQSVSISSDIDHVVGTQTMEMIGREIFSHEQLREYFRVDVTTPLKVAPLEAPLQGSPNTSWQLTGETVDVSGSGLLAMFPESISENGPVRVEVILPTDTAPVVKALAHVVRETKINDNQYQVAFHFDKIDTESHDMIMAACFEIQRHHLRLKVQVKNLL